MTFTLNSEACTAFELLVHEVMVVRIIDAFIRMKLIPRLRLLFIQFRILFISCIALSLLGS